MPLRKICTENVVTIPQDASIHEAAATMREMSVGTLVVIERAGQGRIPVGMLTDRDIVTMVVAPELDASKVSVGDVMARNLVTVNANDGIGKASHLMQANGVRRLPVINDEGQLVGLLSSNDLLHVLSAELANLAGISDRQRLAEIRGDALEMRF